MYFFLTIFNLQQALSFSKIIYIIIILNILFLLHYRPNLEIKIQYYKENVLELLLIKLDTKSKIQIPKLGPHILL